MKKQLKKFLAVFIILNLSFLFQQCNKTSQHPINEDLVNVKKEILKYNSEFENKTNELLLAVQNNEKQEVVKSKFHELRLVYKQMEWGIEYFLPHTARFLNGPAIPEIEMEESIVLEPQGLQVLEELIYEDYSANKQEIIRHLKLLQNKSGAIETNFGAISVNRAQVFDALRNEIFRITSLGLSGFDTPVSGRSLAEIPVALESIKKTLPFLDKTNSRLLKSINSEIEKAIKILGNHPDKNNFDYAGFISQNLNKISTMMLEFKKEQKIEEIEVTTALKKNAPTLFSQNAYDVDAFVPGENFKISDEKIALGKQLFYDPILSKDNNRSCATCHHADKAFTDGNAKSKSLQNELLSRNTPSLNYAAFQHGQFWDMRSADLEGQSSDVITNKDEMHGDLQDIVKKINTNPEYKKIFNKIYKTKEVEQWQLQNVLASYVRSLAKFSSPFDEFMRGNSAALTQNQKEGFNLFVGKANCASCHFMPFFNGTVPPNFSKTEQEVLGTAENSENKKLDADLGRGKFRETVASLQYSFKTPTLRNVAKTAPYMHNGGYRTLQEVMHFYNEGGGKGFGLKVENQTLSDKKLNLTQQEIDKIIDFMKALNDREN